MLLWTNDQEMGGSAAAAQHSLELWLCQFRDLEFSELITSACDLAFLNTAMTDGSGLAFPAILRLVIAREPGVYEALLPLWHGQMQAHYPHMGVSVTDGGIGGAGSLMPPHEPGQVVTRRYRTWGGDAGTVDCADLFSLGYFAFLNQAPGFARYGVDVEDSRKQLRLTQLLQGEGYRHREFTLSIE